MKKNNKGFMLAEVIITSTIVLSAMVGLYLTFNKLYIKYNTISTYKNIDGTYAIENIVDNLIADQNLNNILANKSGRVIVNGECQIIETYCENIKLAYNIENMYIFKMNEESVNELKEQVKNPTFKEYLDYTKKYYKYDENHYLIVLEYKNENEFNYSSMELG